MIDIFPTISYTYGLPFLIVGIIIPLIIGYLSRRKFHRQNPTPRQNGLIICTLFLLLIIPAVIVCLIQAELLGEELAGILVTISVGSLAIFIFTFLFSVYFWAIGIRNQNPVVQEESERDAKR